MFWFHFRKENTPWWLEVQTQLPQCTYYFGPFESSREAKHHRAGYIEDLLNEQAVGLATKIKKCQPEVLTIFDEE
ncbi:MAG: DUF1816 domain-containing protein [Cyanobacteria bacterium P01_A01_bin.17]